jgi:hypothetical protein
VKKKTPRRRGGYDGFPDAAAFRPGEGCTRAAKEKEG